MEHEKSTGHPPSRAAPHAHLPLLEQLASAEDVRREPIHCRLRARAGRARHPLKVVLGDAPRAEEASVGKVLRREVADGQLGQDDLRAALDAEAQLLVDDGPLRVDDGLVGGDVVDAHLGVGRLALELELEVQDEDLGALERLGLRGGEGDGARERFRGALVHPGARRGSRSHLLLKAGVAEGALERHTLDQHALCDGASRHLLDANERQVERRTKALDSVDNHGRKEVLQCGGGEQVRARVRMQEQRRLPAHLVACNELRVEARLGALLEKGTARSRILVELNGDDVEAVDGQLDGLAVALGYEEGG